MGGSQEEGQWGWRVGRTPRPKEESRGGSLAEEKRGAREGALGEGKKEWRDGSKVEHEDSRRSPEGPEHGCQSPWFGVPGIEGRREMGKGCGR